MNTPKSPSPPSPSPFAAANPYASTGTGTNAYGNASGPGYSMSPPAPQPSADHADAHALVYDVTEADVNKRVVERSLHVPVLLDCWAPWCGPCKSLGPVLEKLAHDYGGAFELAKINTDEAPQLSAALRIRSIPLVVLFVGGRPVDQFTGALPEGKIREFLDKHLQAPGDPMEALLAEAAAAEPAEAQALLEEALQMMPGHPDASAALAELWLAQDLSLADVTALLDSVAPEARGDRDTGLRKRLHILANRPAGDPSALAARIAANPRDFEARFALAAHQVFEGDYTAAFDNLLEVVMRDKAPDKPDRERARLQLIDWFAACPDADAVGRGRRYLGMYLN